MNTETFKKICKKMGYKEEDIELIKYNCGYFIEELKCLKNKIYKPKCYINGKPIFEFKKEYEIVLNDCI